MTLYHHDLPIPFEDRWLVAAGAESFVPSSTAYIVDATLSSSLISIVNIKPVRRAQGVALFKNSQEENLTADERVVRILRAFVDGDSLPPVEIVRTSSGDQPFELFNGVHRLYLSLVVGYTHIPAVLKERISL